VRDLVSVIIPAYNAEAYILKAINSILNQTYKNVEVIITDDCSTDKTYQILQSIKDDRIRLYRNENNSGVSFTLNNCIQNSTGSLIAVMHADDIAYPDRIKLQAEFLRANKSLGVIGSQCEIIDEEDKLVSLYPVYTDTYELLLETLLKKIPFPHPSVMYRREAVVNVDLYNSAYDGMEDHDMWLRLAAAGYKFGNIAEPLLKYRRHTTQISQNFSEKDIAKNFSIFYDFVKNLGLIRSYEEVMQFSLICNNFYLTNSAQEFKFFLQFFSDILKRYKFLTASEKQIFKTKFVKKMLKYRSKRKLKSYIDFYYLLKWLLTK